MKLSRARYNQYWEIFQKFDEDESGYIDVEELRTMVKTCGVDMTIEELQEIIKEFDTDGSGQIDFQEFIQIFMKILG